MHFNKKMTVQIATVVAFALVVTGLCVQKTPKTDVAKADQQPRIGYEVSSTAGVSSVMYDTEIEATAFTSGIANVLTDFSDIRIAASGAQTVAMGQGEDDTFCGFSVLGMSTVSEGNLNVREEATTDSHIVGKMTNHNACEILGVEGDWTKISSGKVTGYVKSEYLITGDEALAIAKEEVTTYATVIAGTQTLRVRSKASTESSILSLVGDGEDLVVVSEQGDWVEVEVDDEIGFVSSEYVSISQKLKTAKTIQEVRYGMGVSDVRVAVVQYALQFVGNPYVWGGTSLTKGTDCSGFTMGVLGNYGISLPHSSRAQPAYGTKISASEAQPGDLFFYGSGKSISHVAIYIGNGQIVHASNKREGIKISSAYYRTPICVVSYFN